MYRVSIEIVMHTNSVVVSKLILPASLFFTARLCDDSMTLRAGTRHARVYLRGR